MNISLVVALFLMTVAFIFGGAAWSDYQKAGKQWSVTARTRRRTALIFLVVGVGLLLLAAFSGT